LLSALTLLIGWQEWHTACRKVFFGYPRDFQRFSFAGFGQSVVTPEKKISKAEPETI